MHETIKVYVCKSPDRDNLVTLYNDPVTGKHVTKWVVPELCDSVK